MKESKEIEKPEKPLLTEKTIEEKRALIQKLAESLKDLPSVECPVIHRFAPGLYLREIFMPEGSIVVGKIHATTHFNILLKGECIVVTAEGEQHIKAPHTWISEAGTQKAVLNITDVMWQCPHVTDEIDLDKIEKVVIVDSIDDLKNDALIDRIKNIKIGGG